MGFFCSKLCTKLFGPKDVRILIVGLDGAGKTTMLYLLKTGEKVQTIPTIGFNVETLYYGGLSFTVWDVGGQDKIRVLWKHYYQNTDGLIFVVDSNDEDRIEDAAEELKKMLAEEELVKCPVLILANKQDIDGCLKPEVVEEKIGIKEYVGRIYHVEGISAVKKSGIKEGLDWIAGVILKKNK